MSEAHQETYKDSSTLSTLHPLEPLVAEEITAAVKILRTEKELGENIRFVSVNLNEPAKEVVLHYKPGGPIVREAFIVLLDSTTGFGYEVLVSITTGQVVFWRQLEGLHPGFIPDELAATEVLLKAYPPFVEALRKRGITDLDLVMTDTWTAGDYENPELQQRRLARTIVYTRAEPTDNGYARPVDGLIVLTDLLTNEVLRIDDLSTAPIPPTSGNYTPESIGQMRTDLKPIEITQPDGPSFTVSGHEVHWQKWRFRIGFNTREGLVLNTLTYEDQGRERPILYRASLAEMVVPYGDPNINHYRKNAFDVGEYGLGTLANALRLGCDCLGAIHYFDALMTDSRGELLQLPNALCMHEEDYGILWKHYDWHTNRTEVRRSRRLVVSFIATVDNYEYGFYWYLYQDGTIEFESKLTGIMSTGALPPGVKSKYGQLVAPSLNAPVHQHIFNVRLDMMVDGTNNSVYEVHTEAEPLGPENPYGNAFFAKSTLLATESEAQQIIDPLACRYWKIVNPESRNFMGDPVSYKLMPGENALPFAHPESSIMKRSGFTQKHLWVTPYKQEEHYPAGDYPNQHSGGDGLPLWTQANRAIEDTDIVVWYTMNHNHIPRLEDWPVMPVATIGFTLKPAGFFDRNPALDVPVSESHHDHACDCGGDCHCK